MYKVCSPLQLCPIQHDSMSTPFPGSHLFTSKEAREGRPWSGMVTCLPKSGRLQISDCWKERLSVRLLILSVPGMGIYAPVKINLRFAHVSKVKSSGHSETPKKVYEGTESVNVSCCRLCKSVGNASHLQDLYR